ncbi:DUF2235 domain-containing protein [Croceibacterium sp. TMG7-5b_MA50]|uniref:DUF2235 domain-containing protein n=1 Tax=Croceibacterium sp. TMG7-5b_MA50 TaxID=3121290 RepID=UPI0032217CD0
MADTDRASKDEGGAEPSPADRAIVLFSDGTGNSSGKLFKTNVWRMYEAVDLGPVEGGKRKQIAFYDNGVGTSGFRPLALLGGVFGFGLKRNILEIYRYACRNYRPAEEQGRGAEPLGGDAIYAFGFSRGAFTIRLVIALIASQGLVMARDEADLARLSNDAYRAFRADFLPRKLQWPTRALRWLRGQLIVGWRRLRGRSVYDQALNYRPRISFVGVWDTVAAYGGPIVEITRGIDNWFYALSMPDYCLSPRVECARHALAIDDARDAFHPLLWDEVNEESVAHSHPDRAGRMQQVWFTGMHADVGGGYPDESLSFVSFLWMLEEAQKAGLRTLGNITDRFRALANSAGPLHDSRAGVGAYYRYQPRNIAAWLDGCDPTSIIADPALRHADGRQKGLLRRVQVHESVIARIADGTDRYAPFNLPAAITIIPEGRGEMAALPDSETPGVPPPPEQQPPRPMITDHLRALVEHGALGRARVATLQRVWDRVWLRRGLYFTTLALTALLVAMPLWIEAWYAPPFLADGRTWVGELIRLLAVVTPVLARGLIETAADNSFWFAMLVGAIILLLFWSSRLDRRMKQEAREVWRVVTGQLDIADVVPGGPVDRDGRPSWIQRLRTSRLYRWPLRRLKWDVLPLLAVLILVLVLGWAGAGLLTQLRLPRMEQGRAFCPQRSAAQQLDTVTFNLATAATCTTSRRLVKRDERYSVLLEVPVSDRWYDGPVAATPRGLSAGELGWAGYLGVPFRRVIRAPYLQPMIAIRRGAGRLQWWDRVHIEPLSLRQSVERPTLWRGSFTAARSGELVLFVNEAVPPWGRPDRFYTGADHGNRGRANVTIQGIPSPQERP